MLPHVSCRALLFAALTLLILNQSPAKALDISGVDQSRISLSTSSSVYIVRLRAAPPVAGYTGGINGIPATAVQAARRASGRASRRVGGRLWSRVQSRIDSRSKPVQAFSNWLSRLQDRVAEDVQLRKSNILYKFKYVSNGFAARLSADQLRRLQRHPAVAEVKADRLMSKLTTDSANFLKLPESLWAASGGQNRSGQGVVVGVVDTGVWPEHPSFTDAVSPPYTNPPSYWRGSCQATADFPRCNKKLIGAKFFNAGFHYWYGREDTVRGWTSARDSDGHGTWCAGAAVGNPNVKVTTARKVVAGLATGMAPRAHLAVYKVFWGNSASGGITATWVDVEAAVNTAVADGVDVLSLSLGGADPGANYFGDLAYLYANAAGTTVVYAAGNSGPPPYHSSLYRSVSNFSPFYITVGASTIARRYVTTITFGPNSTPPLAKRNSTLALSEFNFTLPLTGLGTGSLSLRNIGIIESTVAKRAFVPPQYAMYCYSGSLDAAKVKGRVVVCADGGTSIGSMASEVVAKGGKAMLVTDIPAGNKPFLLYDVRIPIMGVEASEVEALRRYIRGTTIPTATLSPTFQTVEDAESAPTVAYFSSTGPIANPAKHVSPSFPTNDIFKPDVIAPGVSLWSAWRSASLAAARTPAFNAISGTSMATPHIAGIAALLVQRNPTWTPADVMSAITTTAGNTNNHNAAPIETGSPGKPASPWDMGAGHVNATALLDPGLTYPASLQHYLNFLAGQSMSKTQLLVPTATNLTAIPAFNLNRPAISVSRLYRSALVTRTVANVANVTSTYIADVVPPSGVTVTVTPGQFTIAPNATVTYTVRLTVNVTSTSFQFGSLTWRDQLGHVVRSVIAVQPLYL